MRVVPMLVLFLALSGALMFGQEVPNNLDPKVFTVETLPPPKIPKHLQWRKVDNCLRIAVTSGDPDKSGPVVILVDSKPGCTTKPHTQPGNRMIFPIKGFRCYFATGAEVKLEKMTLVEFPHFLPYFKEGLHYDGARDKNKGCRMWVTGPGPFNVPPLKSQ